MKYVFTILFLLLYNFSNSQTVKDSLNVQHTKVQTKFGTLTFNQFCNEKSSSLSFHFYYKYLDEKVDQESETNKIELDTVLLEMVIDKDGYMTSFKIIKEGLLNEFTSFVKEMFQELQIEMPKQNQRLKCNMKAGKYIIPVKYNYN